MQEVPEADTPGEDCGRPLTASPNGYRIDVETETMIVAAPIGCDGQIDGPVPPLMARSSRGGAQTLSPGYQTDGHMVLAQTIAFSCKDNGRDATVELSPTLRSMGHAGSHANGGGQMAVCVTGDVTHCLKAEGFDASEDGTGRGQPIVAAMLPIGLDEEQNAMVDAFGCLKARSKGGGFEGSVMLPGMAVRRLTPVECERLQGFADNFTLVVNRKKPAADGPRYKALGNSMAVPVMAYIGRQIQLAVSA